MPSPGAFGTHKASDPVPIRDASAGPADRD
jgi:hypothetical protein